MRTADKSCQLLAISYQLEVEWGISRAGLVRSLMAALFVIFVACQIVQRIEAAEAGDAPAKIASVRIGLKDHYKLGFWTPVRVAVSGAGTSSTLSVEVTVVDSDGVPTTAAAPLPPSNSADGVRTAVVYTMVGRIGNPIRISLLGEEQELD